jgi:hypothetical protein
MHGIDYLLNVDVDASRYYFLLVFFSRRIIPFIYKYVKLDFYAFGRYSLSTGLETVGISPKEVSVLPRSIQLQFY